MSVLPEKECGVTAKRDAEGMQQSAAKPLKIRLRMPEECDEERNVIFYGTEARQLIN